MYRLFRDHNILPGVYYRMPEGEKEVLRAFCLYEVEQRKGG